MCSSDLLTFNGSSGAYALSNTISMMSNFYTLAVPQNAPNRVFSGSNGMLEYTVNYPQPDTAENTVLASNSAFTSVATNNWLPCFLQQEWTTEGGYPDPSAQMTSAEQFDGNTFGFVDYRSGNANLKGQSALVALPTTGSLTLENKTLSGVLFDAKGYYYGLLGIGSSCGGTQTPAGSNALCQYQVSGSDGSGFPEWNNQQLLATLQQSFVAVNPATGQIWADTTGNPAIRGDIWGLDFTPTANGVIPIWSGTGWDGTVASTCQPTDITCSPTTLPVSCPNGPDTCTQTTSPTYHLGGVIAAGKTLNGVQQTGTSIQWHTQLETDIEYPTLTPDASETCNGVQITSSISPCQNVNNLGLYSTWGLYNKGFAAHDIDTYIFTGVNGNWSQFSCQLYQYTEDGMLIGQFGWRGTGHFPVDGILSGAPTSMKGEATAPGLCGNPQDFKLVKQYNPNATPAQWEYYLYVTDENYRKGIQRWHIWNTASINCLSNGTAVTLNSSGISTILNQTTAGECSF